MRRRMTTLWLILAILLMCATPPAASLLFGGQSDGKLDVRLWDVKQERAESMDFYEYLTGCVVACLRPDTDYPDEALCAIAAAMQGRLLSVCGRCEHAKAQSVDFCDDPDHGVPFLSPDQAKSRFGEERADGLLASVRASVQQIRGFGVCYEDQLALTLMHESSYLLTESADSLMGQNIPYLRSVRSYEEAPIQTVRMEKSALALLLRSGFGVEDADPKIAKRTKAGRVAEVDLSGQTVSGVDFADLLMLPSADFEIASDGEAYVFTVRGVGSGIGLSRMGAVAMADQGYGFRQILAAYYPGTEFLPIDTARLLTLGRQIRDG